MAVYDFRQYTLKPGATPDYMAAVRELALPIRQKYGIKLAGWYYSDIGELNQVVHIWAYQDYDHLKEANKSYSKEKTHARKEIMISIAMYIRRSTHSIPAHSTITEN